MEKLLSIRNLKKYFPVAKSSLFQKEKMYVRANEDISIDIYEGETFGLVGESGCGKSTLGRVLLQLYDQTAGSTMYYGRTLEDIAPRYVIHTLQHTDKYLEKYHKAVAAAKAQTEKCDKLGEQATFFDLQEKNLAQAEEKTALDNIVKILGGFMVRDTQKGAALLLERYKWSVAAAKQEAKAEDIRLDIQALEGEGGSAQSSKVSQLKEELGKIENAIADLRKKEAAAQQEVDRAKQPYMRDEEFQRYEAMLDKGIDLARLRVNEMRTLRKDLQIIFQDPYSSLNPRQTVEQIIREPLYLIRKYSRRQIIAEGLTTHKFFKPGAPQMKDYIFRNMESCGLQDYMYNRYPHQFSGGQRQRICIARSLAVKPKFVVCDECVSALDVSIQSQIINLLQELKEKEKLTYLFISHNLSVVRYISDRIGVMYLGNMVEVATTDVLFRDPRHPYTIALLSSIPTTDPDSLTKERIYLEGNIPSPIKPPSGCKFHTRCFMACDKCKRVPPPLVEVEPGHFVACHNLDRKLDDEGNYLFDAATTRAEARS